MARADQLQFMFDLDWWYKDKIVPEKIVAWLLLLFEASESVVAKWISWISKEDETLLPTIMHLFLSVYKRPDDMDIQEARDVLPGFTVDDTYFIEFKNKKLKPLWIRFIEILIDFFPSAYKDTMESLMVDIPAETLEFSYRWRNSRLADWGIPDYFEAIDIYAPVDKTRLKYIESSDVDISQEIVMPAFVPTIYIDELPYLRSALDILAGKPVMSRIIKEWVWVANKLLIADLIDLDDASQLKQVLFRTAGLINIALEELYKDSGESPERLLSKVSIEDLVRIANNTIKPLKSKVLKLIDSNLVHPRAWYLDEEIQNKFLGLLTRQILYWDSSIQEYRGFQSIDEIVEMERLIKDIEQWGNVINYLVKPHWSDWHKGVFENTNIGTSRELTWPMALATLLAQFCINNTQELKPLNVKELKRLKNIWFNEKGKLNEKIVNELVDNLYSEKLSLDKTKFYEIIYSTLKPLEESLPHLKDKDIDPRFIEQIWTIVNDNFDEDSIDT